mmetsp:Transcript_113781/g.361612  ORF Transcript_113781/g.361612 Transcript_113781/m.361612 type:complete len:247 (-) Transcript_113781:1045-1785(-)
MAARGEASHLPPAERGQRNFLLAGEPARALCDVLANTAAVAAAAAADARARRSTATCSCAPDLAKGNGGGHVSSGTVGGSHSWHLSGVVGGGILGRNLRHRRARARAQHRGDELAGRGGRDVVWRRRRVLRTTSCQQRAGQRAWCRADTTAWTLHAPSGQSHRAASSAVCKGGTRVRSSDRGDLRGSQQLRLCRRTCGSTLERTSRLTGHVRGGHVLPRRLRAVLTAAAAGGSPCGAPVVCAQPQQ